MSQSRLRLSIFFMWVTFLALSAALVVLAPVLVPDGTFDSGQVLDLLPGVFAVFLPALSCLAGFWFPDAERRRARGSAISLERYVAAITLTLLYLSVTFVLLMWPLYVVEYPNTLDLPREEELAARMNQVMQLCLMLSPLSLAPIHYLTSPR